ncbi:hypothetical protein E2562_031913, partial [Oryza meyeriana var. granulata]
CGHLLPELSEAALTLSPMPPPRPRAHAATSSPNPARHLLPEPQVATSSSPGVATSTPRV